MNSDDVGYDVKEITDIICTKQHRMNNQNWQSNRNYNYIAMIQISNNSNYWDQDRLYWLLLLITLNCDAIWILYPCAFWFWMVIYYLDKMWYSFVFCFDLKCYDVIMTKYTDFWDNFTHPYVSHFWNYSHLKTDPIFKRFVLIMQLQDRFLLITQIRRCYIIMNNIGVNQERFVQLWLKWNQSRTTTPIDWNGTNQERFVQITQLQFV